MTKTIKENVIDFIKTIPVFYTKKGMIPYISMTNFNIMLKKLEENDLNTQIKPQIFDTCPKNVVVYSQSIREKSDRLSNKLFVKYQNKIDSLIKKEYKKILKGKKIGK